MITASAVPMRSPAPKDVISRNRFWKSEVESRVAFLFAFLVVPLKESVREVPIRLRSCRLALPTTAALAK